MFQGGTWPKRSGTNFNEGLNINRRWVERFLTLYETMSSVF